MKNLYAKSSKNKGKIHPSPSSHSPSPPPSLSLLTNLLPSAILTLASLLSLDDQEVLAYLILRSINTNPSSSSSKKPTTKKQQQQQPNFHCDCFDCYTRFWIRWDSSPNRELIHQAIDAFEDHLDLPKKTHKAKHRTRRVLPDKTVVDTVSDPQPEPDIAVAAATEEVPISSEAAAEAVEIAMEGRDEEDGETGNQLLPVGSVQLQLPASNNRGLVRKVWPDVLGLFNSRLWSLWSPDV